MSGGHEPEGLFADPKPASERPVYVLRFRPEPGVDGIKALRRLLKKVWQCNRLSRLKCLSAVEEGGTALNLDQSP